MFRARHTVVLLAACLVYPEPSVAEDAQARGREMKSYETLNERIKKYSQQEIIALDVGQEYSFALKSGARRTIRLVAVEEHRDRVIGRVRRAAVDVLIDGKPLRVACAPYVMPTEFGGLRIQADTTSGWGSLSKRAQFSLWDSTDPIVDTERFGFPLPDYSLFSHGIQCYNEVVHLGHKDGDPSGQTFYHDYGIDFAGYEAKERVVSCVAGEVVFPGPEAEHAHSVVVQDRDGFFWEYDHFDSILPDIREGARVSKGQQLGMLGRTGPSGNFSHLHVGTYVSKADLEAHASNRRLNLYPWMVAAYQKQSARSLYAVARPHHMALTGEKVLFDGANSLAVGNRIVAYRWEFPDGQTVAGPRAEKAFDRPGLYIATLWVRDAAGNEDVDFCKVKVFTESAPEDGVPTIFMTHTPTKRVSVDQPIHLRCWLQGTDATTMAVDFGDGTVIDEYASYSELEHRFRTPGIHIVSARATISGMPIAQRLKVLVSRSKD